MRRLTALRRITAVAASAAVLATLGFVSAPAAAAETGSVTGVVTAVGTGAPLSGVRVILENSDDVTTGFAVTGEDGTYTASNVPAGEHYVNFDTQFNITPPRDYVSEWYPDVQFKSSATAVTVVAGESLVLDRELALGGSIQGTIKGASNSNASATVTVWAWDAAASEWVVQTRTAGSGTYIAKGLRAGVYRVGFGANYASTGYASEYYNDATTLAGATDVAVQGTATTTGINVTFGSRVMSTERIAGNNRYETAASIARKFVEPETVFIASGENFPDALSAAPAAAMLNSPLLLTQTNALPTATAGAIHDLAPDTVIIMGSSGSVSASVEASILAMRPTAEIIRIAGANRYETSRALVRYLLDAGEYEPIHADTYVATGVAFPDALSVAALAGATRAPLLLVKGTDSTLDSETAALIEDLGNEGVRVIGGPATVSDGIRAGIEDVPGVEFAHREHGANRYVTSLYINQYFSGPMDRAYLASGANFADALAGGALAGLEGVPLYLSRPDCIPLATKSHLFGTNVQEVVLLGGTSSLYPGVNSLAATC